MFTPAVPVPIVIVPWLPSIVKQQTVLLVNETALNVGLWLLSAAIVMALFVPPQDP
jgi:hypothetical protein